jgi:biofilm PGA synthesis N-glycosyltransferase PgaC
MNLEYVLVTAARNEEASIEKTIQSVVSQTILPKMWVIVSDGSTDNTDRIVESYARGSEFMHLLRTPEHQDRQFAAKAHAFNAGYERVKAVDFDIIGNVDADISFGEDYLEFLLSKFQQMPELGVAGTDYTEGGFHSYKDSYISVYHVNGQCQMFRRWCFEQIGGYSPIRGGGIDWVAVTTARMKGWKTYSFSERTYVHHHTMGRTHGGVLSARFHYGRKDYFCGGHPLWQVFRGMYQMTKKPYFIGGLLLLFGYFWSWLTGVKKQVSRELMAFHRKEQMQRLTDLVRGRLNRNR